MSKNQSMSQYLIETGITLFVNLPKKGLFSDKNFYQELYYDKHTNIVYALMQGVGNGNSSVSPYIAPNGLPYKFNPNTKLLEEIIIK